MAKVLTVTLNPAIDVTIQIDTLHVGHVNRQQSAQSLAAGKGLNVAQVLKDLGHKAIITGFLGQENRQIFDKHFAHEGFDNHFIYIQGETRQNIKVGEQSGRMTDINGKGFAVTQKDKDALHATIEGLLDPVEIVVVSGSLPQGFTTTELVELIEWLKSKGKKVVVDTSGPALSAAIRANPWLIKPNTDELAEAYNQPAETFAQQKQLIQDHQVDIENIVISMGEHGVNWVHPVHPLHAKAPRVHVKSTVGAGDSLVAGMIHGFLSQYSPEETLKTATAIGSNAVTQIGFAIEDLSAIDNLKKQITVDSLS
ncbi:1-phosphofructokinase [Acinetobacter sp. B5B]|uniref:1-phosphofructokinase n=1 Tax=Acinetobacter baretiae TaxID=2605383 RepID=UPI0018C2B8AE|nr:1-phosphofructokinase [Acinetobacter baretiae]MBF7683435.1 1-phosphofructokinase [Acinetobacter baretiae]MBF7685802.1 1-phosphofructokinase [Acinetobacter baretiae]